MAEVSADTLLSSFPDLGGLTSGQGSVMGGAGGGHYIAVLMPSLHGTDPGNLVDRGALSKEKAEAAMVGVEDDDTNESFAD